jgi:hypothetical protein
MCHGEMRSGVDRGIVCIHSHSEGKQTGDHDYKICAGRWGISRPRPDGRGFHRCGPLASGEFAEWAYPREVAPRLLDYVLIPIGSLS